MVVLTISLKGKIMSKIKLETNEIYPMSTGLFGGWFCVSEKMSEDDALDYMWNKIKDGPTILEIPTDDKELFRDRLFGGFQCADDSECRHVYFALAHYTFLRERDQRPMSDEDRNGQFHELIEKNPNSKLIESNKFMQSFKEK